MEQRRWWKRLLQGGRRKGKGPSLYIYVVCMRFTKEVYEHSRFEVGGVVLFAACFLLTAA